MENLYIVYICECGHEPCRMLLTPGKLSPYIGCRKFEREERKEGEEKSCQNRLTLKM